MYTCTCVFIYTHNTFTEYTLINNRWTSLHIYDYYLLFNFIYYCYFISLKVLGQSTCNYFTLLVQQKQPTDKTILIKAP